MKTDLPKKSVDGHRQRLRQKFLLSGLDGFLDYEIIELLLTLGTPRKDCKQPAKEAIGKFGGLVGTLNASSDELEQINGIGPSNSFGIKLFKSLAERYAKEKIDPKKLLNTPRMVYEFLREKIGNEKKEHFIVLFLDTKNNLIYNDVSIGTINASIVHPREVFVKALLHHATHVVLAHNHPTGDPSPSDEDIETTKRLIEAGKIIGITVADHIVVSTHDYRSLREMKSI